MRGAKVLAGLSAWVLLIGLKAVAHDAVAHAAGGSGSAPQPNQPLFSDDGETSTTISVPGDIVRDPQVAGDNVNGGQWPPPGMEATDLPSPGRLPGGGPCIDHNTVLVPEGGPGSPEQLGEAGAYLGWYYNQLAAGAGSIPDCPGGGQAVPDVVQIRAAIGARLADRVPRPEPRIQPGWMIVGMKGFLETARPLTFGPETWTVSAGGVSFEVELTGRGSYMVDWGDGQTTGPYEVAGTAWPEGTVTHVWELEDAYDITVTDTWTVTWSSPFGQDSLTRELAPVTLEDFSVREVESARVR